ncbi:MAG: hypothetical protein ABFC71_01455 [Methanoregula sp.]
MKKCTYCGGNNSEMEVYCDWCGEILLPEKKMTLLLFLKYYFHSFALLGIIGAIIFYISNFLINPNNSVTLNQEFLGISLTNTLQFGLFICFCFFILLLVLLEIELGSIKKRDFSIKFLMLLLVALLIFVCFLFILVGLSWLQLIITVILTFFIFIIYVHILDIFVMSEGRETTKTRNLLIIIGISLCLFVLFMIFSHSIINFVNDISQYPLPYEKKPILLSQMSNGFFVGILFGLIIGMFISAIYMIINGSQITINQIRSFFKRDES